MPGFETNRLFNMYIKKRISYYDVAKGVLICLVIISHIYLETLSVAKIPNSTFAWLRSWQWIHVSFFMPAFFIITGLCSNFNKDFNLFLINNVRTILIPAIFFDLFFFSIPSFLMGQGLLNDVMMGFVKRALAFGGVFWFLPCLFISKTIYWILHNYTRDSIRWGLLIALVIFGFLLHHFKLFPQKWWYFHQVCDLTLFLGIGQFLKNTNIDRNIIYRVGTVLFLIIIIIFLISKLPMPSILYTYKIHEWWQLPVHILVSIGGTSALLWICKTINTNSFLEYFGRGTIIVYGVHQLFLKILLKLIEPLVANQGFIISIIMFLVIFSTTVGFCALSIMAFNSKYLKTIIGK